MLLLKRCLDNAIAHGDGNTLGTIIKHIFLYFRALGANNYAILCFEFIAQQQIFLSEKMNALVRQERFVNNAGGESRNLPVDLGCWALQQVF